jgi:hypothetical protein
MKLTEVLAGFSNVSLLMEHLPVFAPVVAVVHFTELPGLLLQCPIT